MIRVFLKDGTEKKFKTKQCALRFMYAMRGKGILILGWMCSDPYDNEWLDKRFRL